MKEFTKLDNCDFLQYLVYNMHKINSHHCTMTVRAAKCPSVMKIGDRNLTVTTHIKLFLFWIRVITNYRTPNNLPKGKSKQFSEEGGTSIVNKLHQHPRVTWSILTTKVNVKNTFTSHIDKTYFWHFCWLPYLYTCSLYENPSFIIVSAETEYISTNSWYWNINFLRDRIRRIFS